MNFPASVPYQVSQFCWGEYRYTFQGQESDDEVKGAGNSINYKFRMHDPRVGRFFAGDPLFRDYPSYSSYAFSQNRLVDGVELEGLEYVHFSNTGHTVNITGMNAEKVEAIFEKNSANFDSDWLDASAKNEHWKITTHKDYWKNSTGTTIDKFSTKASYEKSGATPYFREWDRTFVEWLASWDEALDHEGGWKKGVGLSLTTMGVILSGGTLLAAEGLGATVIAGSSFLLSVDDLTSSPEGETVLTTLAGVIGGEEGMTMLKAAKLTISVHNGAKGFAKVTVEMADGNTVKGVYDMINDTFDVIQGSWDTGTLIEEGSKTNE